MEGITEAKLWHRNMLKLLSLKAADPSLKRGKRLTKMESGKMAPPVTVT
jgi:hypothetical protein